MKILLLCYCLIYSSSLVLAQGSYFSTIQPNDWNGSIHSQLELVNGEIYTLGLYQTSEDFGHVLQLYDENGDFIEDLELYSGDTVPFYSSALKRAGEYLYFSGYKWVEPFYTPYGAKYNLDGELIWQAEVPEYISDSLQNAPFTTSFIFDNGVLFCGEKTYDIDDDPFPDMTNIWLIKVNSQGHFIWEKEFNIDINKSVRINNAFELSNGDILLSGAVYADWNQILVRLDSNGNHLWTYEWGGELDDWLPWAVQEENNEFTIAYQKELTTSGWGTSVELSEIHVMRFNADTQDVLWDITYEGELDRPGLYDFIKTADGGYIMLGQLTLHENDIWKKGTFIKKIDAFGNEEWHKTYVNPEHPDFIQSILYDIEQTSDCGYVMAGETYGGEDQPKAAWLLKIDQCGEIEFNGCMPCTDSVGEFDVRSSKFEVYPNPAENQITLELEHLTFGSQLNASIKNTLGQEVITQEIYSRQTELNVSHLPSGVYMLSLVGDGRELSSKRMVVE